MNAFSVGRAGELEFDRNRILAVEDFLDVTADGQGFFYPVAKGSFHGNGREKEVPATLELSRDAWEGISRRLPPLQRPPLAFGAVRLAGVPVGNPLFQYGESIANLLALLPGASLRVGTILNLEAIMAVLIAA